MFSPRICKSWEGSFTFTGAAAAWAVGLTTAAGDKRLFAIARAVLVPRLTTPLISGADICKRFSARSRICSSVGYLRRQNVCPAVRGERCKALGRPRAVTNWDAAFLAESKGAKYPVRLLSKLLVRLKDSRSLVLSAVNRV